MSAAIFRAHDACQRAHLLRTLDEALDFPASVGSVIEGAYEGGDTSLYLWTFFDEGMRSGYRLGRRRGREDAFRPTPHDAVARAKARRNRRKAKQR